MFPLALYVLVWDGEWEAKQLWDDTQQSAKLGLTFFSDNLFIAHIQQLH